MGTRCPETCWATYKEQLIRKNKYNTKWHLVGFLFHIVLMPVQKKLPHSVSQSIANQHLGSLQYLSQCKIWGSHSSAVKDLNSSRIWHCVTGRVALDNSHNHNDLIFILPDITIRKRVFYIDWRGQNCKKIQMSPISFAFNGTKNWWLKHIYFIQSKCSLPWSHEPYDTPYHEPLQCDVQPQILFSAVLFIWYPHVCLALLSCSHLSYFPIKILQRLLVSPGVLDIPLR